MVVDEVLMLVVVDEVLMLVDEVLMLVEVEEVLI